jgi:hypothetical protein
MTATAYLPIQYVAKVQNFVQFSSTTSALATALNTAFATAAGFIQVTADTTTGQTTNALVVAADAVVLTVPVNNWIGFNNGVWQQFSPAQMTAMFVQYFTS